MPWQPIPVVYPDAELLVCGYLRTQLSARVEPYAGGVLVGIRIPDTRPDRMIIVRRDGGLEGELRDQARISLRVFATTEQDATDLARLSLALLKAMRSTVPEVVNVIQQSGPQVVDDPSGLPLRYLIVEIHTRGADL